MGVSSRLVCVGLVGGVWGCGGTTEPLPACSGAVSVTVTEGTTPTIAWTPACGAERLAVTGMLPPSLGLGAEQRWSIRADGRLIEPPVRYGRAPRGTAVDVPPGQLAAGQTFVVSVGNGFTVLGSKSFVP
jgi:hypothetical protein